MKRKNAFVILIASAAILLIAAFILLMVDFDSPQIGKAFLEKIGESTELEWEAETFRLNLLRGLSLENVNAAGLVGGKRMEARIKHITVKHRVLPLLRKEISAREIVIQEPEVDLFPASKESRSSTAMNRPKQKVSGAETAPAPAAAEEEQLRVGISQLRIENALITVHSTAGRKPEAVIRSLSLTLNDLTLNEQTSPTIQRFSAKGDVHADEIIIGKTHVQESEGQIEIAEGQIRAKELSFESEEGEFEAELSLNVMSSPATYKLFLKGDPVNTNLLLVGKEKDDLGPTRLEFQGEGTGTKSQDLQGQGQFTLEDGKLPSSPVFETIQRMVGEAEIVGAAYKAGTTPFRIQGNRFHLDGFVLEIDQGSMDLSGWVSLDGPLRLECKVRVPRKNVKMKEIPKEVLDALTDEAGLVILPFKIRGIPQNPITELDTGALLAQAGEGTKRILKQKLTEKLKDLLRKRND